jgi:putative heme-binding domain-containing protein
MPRFATPIHLSILLFQLVTISVYADEPNADEPTAVARPTLEHRTNADQTLTDQLLAEPIEDIASDVQKFGDPSRGAIEFYRSTMNCARCHESKAGNRKLGPDLSEKREVTISHLIESVLQPSAQIREGFETTEIFLDDGNQISGVFISESDLSVVIDRIEEAGQPLAVPKSEIEIWKKTSVSSMPSALANQLGSRQQFLDLISYLDAIASGGGSKAAMLKPATALTLPLPEYESRLDHAGILRKIAEDEESAFARGAETFRLRCASCHGTLDEPGSMPTSLRFASGKFKNGNKPLDMYNTLTHGYGMMNPQRSLVPIEKHEVIHFIREHFLRNNNPSQYFEISDEYLASLPDGNTFGPEPRESRPWTDMDYGPSLNNTIEVGEGGTNIAQKGIVVRLDAGPGGVESGSHWMMYEHDTMRVAAAWHGEFIDWEGIHFNGTHGTHPRVTGEIVFANETGPGFANEGSFDDEQRVVGRDGKRYGPLPEGWMKFQGIYRYGNQTILKYRVGQTEVLETPGLTIIDDQPVFTRTLNLGKRSETMVLQIANVDAESEFEQHQSPKASDSVSKNVVTVTEEDENCIIANITFPDAKWFLVDESLRLAIPPGPAVNFVISIAAAESTDIAPLIKGIGQSQLAGDLKSLTNGGPQLYPQLLKSKLIRGDESGPFAVDVFQRPTENPWNAQLRLTGLDFLADNKTAIVTAWDGSVWRVQGFAESDSDELTWQRIASGLFQPLGVKVVNEKIYVTCRDQIVILHDLNGDFETDWYENFNSDHQVTEHFHEFAMGLQTDDDGNFYYAKSARHAKKAVVPHHGTLLKVSPDGSQTEIVANGFRAANGVCINPDGSFVVTDQEGHWNPKNRINWVKPGGFYGNMFGYHNVEDDSDDAMEKPLCWITNSFDRSPAELLWVDSEKWGSLNGTLLNFSYGYGKVYIVPHEEIDGQVQGGMCEFPIDQFPTGVMRGRFNKSDGQLYCCGMFAWAGSQQQPGGFYRIRRTEKEVHLPTELAASKGQIQIKFSSKVDEATAQDSENYAINTWDLERTKNYGSDHFNEKELPIQSAKLLDDQQTIVLKIEDLKPTRGMEINFSIKSASGKPLRGKIHNSINVLPK